MRSKGLVSLNVKTILCYGDSNTWGVDPTNPEVRFRARSLAETGSQAALGAGYEVIAEGLNGRTATLDSPVADGRNGLTYLCRACTRNADRPRRDLPRHQRPQRPLRALPSRGRRGERSRAWCESCAREAGQTAALRRCSSVCPPPFARLDPDGSFATAGDSRGRSAGTSPSWRRCSAASCSTSTASRPNSDLDGIHLEAMVTRPSRRRSEPIAEAATRDESRTACASTVIGLIVVAAVISFIGNRADSKVVNAIGFAAFLAAVSSTPTGGAPSGTERAARVFDREAKTDETRTRTDQ